MPRILFVNDQPELIPDGYFERCGAEVVANALNGTDGIRMARELWGKYDLILMDVQMPGGIDGIEATRQIITENPDARIVMYSNSSRSYEGIEAGAIYNLSTTSDMFTVRNTLAELCAS